jgi:hypothetical protein
MVTIQEKAKRQRILLGVFFIVLSITFLILYFGYFRKGRVEFTPLAPKREIKIDLTPLQNPILKELQPIEQIEPVKPEDIGRENPFSPIK